MKAVFSRNRPFSSWRKCNKLWCHHALISTKILRRLTHFRTMLVTRYNNLSIPTHSQKAITEKELSNILQLKVILQVTRTTSSIWPNKKFSKPKIRCRWMSRKWSIISKSWTISTKEPENSKILLLMLRILQISSEKRPLEETQGWCWWQGSLEPQYWHT